MQGVLCRPWGLRASWPMLMLQSGRGTGVVAAAALPRRVSGGGSGGGGGSGTAAKIGGPREGARGLSSSGGGRGSGYSSDGGRGARRSSGDEPRFSGPRGDTASRSRGGRGSAASSGAPPGPAPRQPRARAPAAAAAAAGLASGLRGASTAAAPRETAAAAAAAADSFETAEFTHDGATDDGVPAATFVPRDPRIRDGPWSQLDASLVKDAQAESARAAVAASEAAAAAAAAAVGSKKAAAAAADALVLLGQSPEQLRQLVASLGQPAFRGQQIYDLLMKPARDVTARGARSVDEMHTLPQALREQLVALGVTSGRSAVHHSVASPCGTRKLLLQVAEGRLIETVGIPVEGEGKQRLTVCVSSQVGCPMRCTFCATGKGGFARNLRPHEILDQVMTIQEEYGRRVTNVVFMGQGEPLLNLPSVAAAYHLLHDGLGISGRAITISTVGVSNAIGKLADMKLPVTLAVSLHAPNQQLRERLIPSAKVYPLEALMRDCTRYFLATKRRITFEYTLLAGVNDGTNHARELAALLTSQKMPPHVNLIPWNPVDDSDYQRPTSTSVEEFKKTLERAGVEATLRTTRGLEAAAACGQLRNQFQKQAVPEPRPLR